MVHSPPNSPDSPHSPNSPNSATPKKSAAKPAAKSAGRSPEKPAGPKPEKPRAPKSALKLQKPRDPKPAQAPGNVAAQAADTAAGQAPGNTAATAAAAADVVTIRKYANRRLYNTATSSYVTLQDLGQMVRGGEDFTVHDARSGADITRAVLTQIIVEEEARGQNLLPVSFLRRLICFYGDSLQMVVPRYLDQAMTVFTDNQDQTRARMKDAFGGFFPFDQLQDMSKQNMALFENAMTMFAAAPDSSESSGTADSTDGTPSAKPLDPLGVMQEQLNMMQRQLRALSGQSDDKS